MVYGLPHVYTGVWDVDGVGEKKERSVDIPVVGDRRTPFLLRTLRDNTFRGGPPVYLLVPGLSTVTVVEGVLDSPSHFRHRASVLTLLSTVVVPTTTVHTLGHGSTLEVQNRCRPEYGSEGRSERDPKVIGSRLPDTVRRSGTRWEEVRTIISPVLGISDDPLYGLREFLRPI